MSAKLRSPHSICERLVCLSFLPHANRYDETALLPIIDEFAAELPGNTSRDEPASEAFENRQLTNWWATSLGPN